MRSFLAGLRRLVIPWGAGPNSPAVVISDQIPAELVGYYTTVFGFTVYAVVIARFDNDDYMYDALINQGPGVNAHWTRGVVVGGVVNDKLAVGIESGSDVITVGLLEASTLRIGTALFPNSDLTVAGESIVNSSLWTPVLTQSITNPTAGFDSTFGRRRLEGDVCRFLIVTTILDATKAGTGNLRWTLPFDLLNDTQLAIASAIDTSTGTRFPCTADLDSGGAGTVLTIRRDDGTAVTQANPFAVANGDLYSVQGWYFAAP